MHERRACIPHLPATSLDMLLPAHAPIFHQSPSMLTVVTLSSASSQIGHPFSVMLLVPCGCARLGTDCLTYTEHCCHAE